MHSTHFYLLLHQHLNKPNGCLSHPTDLMKVKKERKTEILITICILDICALSDSISAASCFTTGPGGSRGGSINEW